MKLFTYLEFGDPTWGGKVFDATGICSDGSPFPLLVVEAASLGLKLVVQSADDEDKVCFFLGKTTTLPSKKERKQKFGIGIALARSRAHGNLRLLLVR